MANVGLDEFFRVGFTPFLGVGVLNIRRIKYKSIKGPTMIVIKYDRMFIISRSSSDKVIIPRELVSVWMNDVTRAGDTGVSRFCMESLTHRIKISFQNSILLKGTIVCE
jgi:hypothetical protein